jgi:hypothetical protein
LRGATMPLYRVCNGDCAQKARRGVSHDNP